MWIWMERFNLLRYKWIIKKWNFSILNSQILSWLSLTFANYNIKRNFKPSHKIIADQCKLRREYLLPASLWAPSRCHRGRSEFIYANDGRISTAKLRTKRVRKRVGQATETHRKACGGDRQVLGIDTCNWAAPSFQVSDFVFEGQVKCVLCPWILCWLKFLFYIWKCKTSRALLSFFLELFLFFVSISDPRDRLSCFYADRGTGGKTGFSVHDDVIDRLVVLAICFPVVTKQLRRVFLLFCRYAHLCHSSESSIATKFYLEHKQPGISINYIFLSRRKTRRLFLSFCLNVFDFMWWAAHSDNGIIMNCVCGKSLNDFHVIEHWPRPVVNVRAMLKKKSGLIPEFSFAHSFFYCPFMQDN